MNFPDADEIGAGLGCLFAIAVPILLGYFFWTEAPPAPWFWPKVGKFFLWLVATFFCEIIVGAFFGMDSL